MTTEEVRKKLLESSNLELFNSLSVTLHFNSSNTTLHFEGFIQLFEFIKHQNEAWDKNTTSKKEFINSTNMFSRLFRAIKNFIQSYSESSVDTVKNAWKETKLQLQNLDNQVFIFEAPETQFLFSLDKTPLEFEGAYKYFTLNTLNTNNVPEFTGALRAYEFRKQLNQENKEHENISIKSFKDLGQDFQNYYNRLETQVTEYLTGLKNSYKTHLSEINTQKKSQEDIFHNWFTESQNEISTFHKDSTKKIIELENTYQEQLRLKKPAEFWKVRANNLKKEGNQFFCFLIGLVLAGVGLLYCLLWLTPEGMLKSLFNEDKSLAIRWSIIFIVFISLIFLGIRFISKAMFSAYHLARDAEEREQLTYVYLALIKESAVDDKDKHLIMQSIFSRADTGLLKEDSSPTMPSGIDKIINRN